MWRKFLLKKAKRNSTLQSAAWQSAEAVLEGEK